MKKYLILAALLVVAAFGQLRFSAGSFYGDITASQTNTSVLIGALPAGAVIASIRIGEAIKSTNVAFTNSIQIGTATTVNYFLSTTQLPLQVAPSISIPTGISNGFIVLNAKSSTPIYGYVTRAGALVGAAYGTYRIVVGYVQK